MYDRYGLVLMVTHACNLRCTYCYTGHKFQRSMPFAVGRKAIDRALSSLGPGGTLELGFFGGEPLLEADLIGALIPYAADRCADMGISLSLSMTTNGAVVGQEAWSILLNPQLDLAISFDGLPAWHDRHRPTVVGQGSSERVLHTIAQLVNAGRDFRVITVVRPDTVSDLPEGIWFLWRLGVRHIEPSLDLWTQWGQEDVARLQSTVAQCADIWREGLPHHSIGWFDEKAAQLAHVAMNESARCGFGNGEIAVAPSGRLYPCERLIGEDLPGSDAALPGHVMEGENFLEMKSSPLRSHEACDGCEMLSMCNAFCRCSNYARTGDVRTPDWLLCAWNQACLLETARVMRELNAPAVAG